MNRRVTSVRAWMRASVHAFVRTSYAFSILWKLVPIDDSDTQCKIVQTYNKNWNRCRICTIYVCSVLRFRYIPCSIYASSRENNNKNINRLCARATFNITIHDIFVQICVRQRKWIEFSVSPLHFCLFLVLLLLFVRWIVLEFRPYEIFATFNVLLKKEKKENRRKMTCHFVYSCAKYRTIWMDNL